MNHIQKEEFIISRGFYEIQNIYLLILNPEQISISIKKITLTLLAYGQ
jgi:hypothetical protein